MSSPWLSQQSYGSDGPQSRPARANTANPNDIISSSRPSKRHTSPQVTPNQDATPFLDPCGSPSSAVDRGNTVSRSSSTQKKNKKGMLSFMSGVSSYSPTTSKRPEISTPYNPIHLTHVRSNPSTGEFTGLPDGWKQTLQKNNNRYQEKNRQAVAETLKFYQGTARAHETIARRYMATGSTIPQQTNGIDGLVEGSSQNPSIKRTMSGVSQGIIDYALDFILNYPREPCRHVKGDQTSGQDSTLREIDGEIDLMAKTLGRLLTGLRASLTVPIIQRKKERNILVRLHQLPLEIASDILWLSIVDPWEQRPSYSFLQRLRTISSVCSSWRTVVECSPRFWSIVELTAPQRAIPILLEKSKYHPLEIKCFSDGQYNFAPRMNRTGPLELIAPHTHRIRSLILSAPSTDGILAVLDKPAPMLEELKLSFDHCEFIEPVDIFCGQVGRLKDVALENIPVRWDSGALVGLRSLKIKGNLGYSPTESEVVRLLEANPGLEKMEIEDVTVTEDFGDSVGLSRIFKKRRRLIMSNMQELRLFSLPFELVRVILGTVEIPSIRHLDLKCLFDGHPASQLLGPHIKHLVPPIIQGSTGAELAELTFREESVGLAVYLPHQANPAIRIQLNNTAPVSGCEWFAENFFTAKGLPSVGAPEKFQVALKFGDSFNMQGGAFIPILDRLGAARVKGLKIGSGCKRGEELIKYLGEMKEGSRWPLPHLMSLTMEGSATASMATHLLVALQSRKYGVDLTGMAALEALNIKGLGVIDAEVEGALAELIGPSGTFIRATRPPFWGHRSSVSMESFRSWRSITTRFPSYSSEDDSD